MAPVSTARTVARRLVRTGLKARAIRERVHTVVRKKRAELADAPEAEVVQRATEQLVNEAFSELRYRSILVAMRDDIPRLPLPSTTSPDVALPDFKKPSVASPTPDDMLRMQEPGRQASRKSALSEMTSPLPEIPSKLKHEVPAACPPTPPQQQQQ
eukprot:Rhum_TRINITY_DN14379_c17_g2::Rhum_TRINITY_DN14379_c17_g2_i1::g.86470::m.86470